MKKLEILALIAFLSFSGAAQSNLSVEIITNVLNFDWRPDGKSICFAAVRHGSDWKNIQGRGIFKIDLNTGQTVQLIINGYSPSVSPDGKKMAYTKVVTSNSKGNTDIYLYDFKTKVEEPAASDTVRESSPSWSPDGKKLVYTVLTNREKGIRFANLDLWIVELSTGKTKQITESNSFKNYNPVWAPQGNKIVYYLEKGDNRDQIYLTDENGSFHTNLTADTATHNYYPSWLGTQILYTQSPGKIILMNQEGSQKSIIENLPAFWARYNSKADKIAYFTQGSREKPSEFKILDMKTKESSVIMSKEALDRLVFSNK